MPWVRWHLRGSEVGPRCLRGSEWHQGEVPLAWQCGRPLALAWW
jgi:hypothetical protein